MWRLVVADVTYPFIGVDILFHFGLLVDCRHNCLLDEPTFLSLTAKVASSMIPSVNIISGGTLFDTFVDEFPGLTRPAGAQREVRHNTVHHIRTIPSPPVTYRPQRLVWERLAIDKVEFDAMLRDDTARRSENS
jgi:hypothetical protein